MTTSSGPPEAVVYDDPKRRDKRGLQALIIGISAYPNLPPPTASQSPHAPPPRASTDVVDNTLGLKQLESAAPGAVEIASWLIKNRKSVDPPLASVRLLLTPQPGMAKSQRFANVPVPSLDNLQSTAFDWREDAKRHPDNMTLFYFAGHGVQRGVEDHVLLLHDFGKKGPLLASSCSAAELIGGMRRSGKHPSMAQRQLYFFDACKLEPKVFKEYEKLNTGTVWDVDAVDVEDRRFRAFHSTMAGHAAYGSLGGHSLFCEALLQCLKGAAAEEGTTYGPQGSPPWIITADSLALSLDRVLKAVATNAGIEQSCAGFRNGHDFTIRTLPSPPLASVNVRLSPSAATQVARLSVLSVNQAAVAVGEPPLEKNPLTFRLEAGNYRIRARDSSQPRRFPEDPADAWVNLKPDLPRNVIICFQD